MPTYTERLTLKLELSDTEFYHESEITLANKCTRCTKFCLH